MLTSVSIKNFQSLHDVTVELKGFTVIVGPSSSGKSAFTRALKTLTSNQRGEAFITHGETQAVIKAKTDRGTVALLRGKKNEYVIIPEDDATQQRVFTKLAGNTPEEVSEFIGIPAKDPLNYSNQFDMPYLLTSSAAEVARTLGELTNVSVIFEASREANRQRLQASSTLKTRAGDYDSLTQNLEKYKNLKSNGIHLEDAEAAVERARNLQTRISELEGILSKVVDIPASVDINIPDLTNINNLDHQVSRLRVIISSHTKAEEDYWSAEDLITLNTDRVMKLDEAYSQVLKDAGTCPTCGADTSGHKH